MKKAFARFICSTLSFLLITQSYVPLSFAGSSNNLVSICKCDPDNPENYSTVQCRSDQLQFHCSQGAALGSCDSLGNLVTLCYVGQNNSGPKTIQVPLDLARNFFWKGAHYGACDNGKIKICHVPPGNPAAAHTLEIDSSGLNGHIPNHPDDYVGECASTNCTKVLICDVAPDARGTASEKYVCEDEVEAHLDDGDYLGHCENGRPKVPLCHKNYATNTTTTIQVSICAAFKHLIYNDQWGPCPPTPSPVCGNGIVEPGEQCDDGAETSRCNKDCTLSSCGDGKLNPSAGELCDDGNRINTDACLNTCVPASCGDGYTWAGREACDDAGWSIRCNNDCTLSSCGDTKVNVVAGEQCDFGNNTVTNGCSGTCQRLHVCGDGVIDPGEQCDNGIANSNIGACLPNCKANVCGDGFVNQGVEQCDDGNQNNFDACKNNCTPNTCGDGYVYEGVEQCDDGNQLNTDQCLNNCQIAVCGDGYVRTGIEQCDDGNTINTDYCLNTCQTNVCHDGYQSPAEQCDDGNYINTDACVGNCTTSVCGDGFIWAGVEYCDDGLQNGQGNGFCLKDCSAIAGTTTIPPSTTAAPTPAPSGGSDNTGLIVGLAVGVPALVIVAGILGFIANRVGSTVGAGAGAAAAAQQAGGV